MRARARQTPAGIDLAFNPELALEATPDQRRSEYETRWAEGGFSFMGAFGDLMLNAQANDTAAEFVRGKICEIVKDPVVAEALSPRDVIGSKRLCVDTGYWETFNRPNVTLVDASAAPIDAITRDGVKANGSAYRLDAIVLATGFDAMTGALLRIDITGPDGRTLKEKWAEGPKTYLGLATAGFPTSSPSPARAAPRC